MRGHFAIVLIIITFIIGATTGYVVGITSGSNPPLISPLGKNIPPTPRPKPLLKYTFDNLSRYTPQASNIILDELISDEGAYSSYQFSYTSLNKNITGQINLPQTATPAAGFPTILMIRGFIEPGAYQTGMGTKNAAAFFAQNGFATIAPDFLGFGASDPPAVDVMEARLEKPVNVLDLLASINSSSYFNPDALGIWGHSNGGQITLSILEITQADYPTTLWAPVSKPFPYSILFYTDQYDDQGKALRQAIADFESLYDVYDYSIDKYWDRIQAPLQIHQGTADPDVPIAWTNQLVDTLTNQEKEVTYYTYPGADHNLRPDWNTVVQRDLTFFQQHL